MKKALLILLTLVLTFTIAACSGNSDDKGDKSPSEGSVIADESSTSTDSQDMMEKDVEEKKEIKVYGIGEAAEANGLSFTIDKVEAAGPNTMLEKAKDGFTYMKVWFTFKNVSNETIESPKQKALYLVYEEGPTGDDSDMTSEENSQVMLEVADRDERYMERIDLAPEESTGGWMIYQRQADKNEVIMHYYSKFVNVPPDLVFKFDVE